MKLKKTTSKVSTDTIENLIKLGMPHNEEVQSLSLSTKNNILSATVKTINKDGSLIKNNEWDVSQEDIYEFLEKYLNDKNISFIKDSFELKFEHVDGDLREPMDYGYNKFVGISFNI